MNSRHLHTIERWTLILAAIAIAAAVVAASRSTAFAVTVGAGLMVGNAIALRRIGSRVLASATPGMAVLLLNLKMLLLVALVYVGVRILHLDTAGFLIGVSVFPVAMVIAALRFGAAEATAPTDETPDPLSPSNGGR